MFKIRSNSQTWQEKTTSSVFALRVKVSGHGTDMAMPRYL